MMIMIIVMIIVIVMMMMMMISNILELLAFIQTSLKPHVRDEEDLGGSLLTSPFAFKLIGLVSRSPSVHTLRHSPVVGQDDSQLNPACSLPPLRTKDTSPTSTTHVTTRPFLSTSGNPTNSFKLAVLSPDPPLPVTPLLPCRPPLPRPLIPHPLMATRTSMEVLMAGYMRPPMGRW